jgi:hypothetical protein
MQRIFAITLAGLSSFAEAGGVRTKRAAVNVSPTAAPTATNAVLAEMDTMVARLTASLAEAKETRDRQLRSVMGEEQSQATHTGAKKALFDDITKCKAESDEHIAANNRATADAKSRLVSTEQIEKWEAQAKEVVAHAAPFREAYAEAETNFQKRYKHLSQVRRLIHNMTAKMNDYYVRKTPATADAPRFKSMLAQLSAVQTMVNNPNSPVVAAELDVDNIHNSTTAERTSLSNEDHVTATEKALDDVSQAAPGRIDARGQNVNVGSDVGGYVYLVLTRISGTVADELSALKASFQLETATRKSVMTQADDNTLKLSTLIQDAKITNEKVGKEIVGLKERLAELEIEKATCKRRVEIAEKSWIGSKNLGTNLHVTTAELTAQLDRQINDIQHELQLATWVRKLMTQKLATLKKRAAGQGSGSSVEEEEPKVEEPIEAHDDSCLKGGPKDWCSSPKQMKYCGVSKAACDAYLLQDAPDYKWPGHDADQAGGTLQ